MPKPLKLHIRFRVLALLCATIYQFPELLHSQNLIINHSFEYGNCPTSIGQLNYCYGWWDANNNTSDYFNPCGISYMDPPGNLFGTQAAADGVCYAGFRAITPGSPGHYEFPTVAFSPPLEPCQLYTISYKVSRAAGDQGGGWAVDELGFALFDQVLTPTLFSQQIYPQTGTFEPSFKTPPGVFITDSTGWTTISGTYLATGGEVCLVLGNFELANTNLIWAGGLSTFSAYYFVDDVHVERATTLLGQDVAICEGDSVTLNVGHMDTILWSDGSSDPYFTITAPGTYWVTVGSRACTVTDTIVVSVHDYPDFSLGNDTALCRGETFPIGASVPGTYSWSTGSTAQNILPDSGGTYSLTVNWDGCETSDEITLEFEDCIFVPNAFSPNGDGQNDLLFVRGYKSGYFHFLVFDRWGTKVFETEDPLIGWDGTIGGQPAMEGVYNYYVELDYHVIEGRYVKKGNVSLIR